MIRVRFYFPIEARITPPSFDTLLPAVPSTLDFVELLERVWEVQAVKWRLGAEAMRVSRFEGGAVPTSVDVAVTLIEPRGH